jgi:hypothetical protein
MLRSLKDSGATEASKILCTSSRRWYICGGFADKIIFCGRWTFFTVRIFCFRAAWPIACTCICRRGGIRGGGRNEAISQIKPRLTRKKVPYGSPTMTKSKKKANEVADYNDRVQQAVDGIRSGLYRSSYHAATELNVKPNSRQCCRDLPAQGSLVSNGIRSVQEPNRNRSGD